MSYLKQAITGTNDYHAVMQAALVEGLRVQGGYVPKVAQDDELPQFSVFKGHHRDVVFDTRECTVFHLSPISWIELIFPSEEMKLRYPLVLVFRDFVVFCWRDALDINYEWCQLEVSRAALIEMWSERYDWIETYNLMYKDTDEL